MMNRNKVLIVDIDPEREHQIIIAHGNRKGDEINPTSEESDVIGDMASLCEALCTLIHSAEHAGIKDSPSSLRDCINHLEQRFADASYFAKMTYK